MSVVLVSAATDFHRQCAALVVSFSGGVTNVGAISPKGIQLESAAFIGGGGILDTGTRAGGIKIDSGSEILASGDQCARKNVAQRKAKGMNQQIIG
jgi:hypothetical protein